MSENKNGGPAFPMGYHRDGNGADHRGMTLRDYFAAKAMQGLLSIPDERRFTARDTKYKHLTPDAWQKQLLIDDAKMYYDIADAMLKAREQ